MALVQASDAAAVPWHAAYPSPRDAQPGSLAREQVLEMLKSGANVPDIDFLLIDLRRNDHEVWARPSWVLYAFMPYMLSWLVCEDVHADVGLEQGGTIRGSINLPAQSLYPTIPTLYTVFKAACIHTIIWYCSSSQGRGTRAAGWFSDYLADRGDHEMRSVILRDGIKGWARAGHEYTEWMDEYDASKWVQ